MDALSRLGLADVVDREVGEMIPVVIGVDPGSPEGDTYAEVEVRRGELGCIDRFRIITSPRVLVLGEAGPYERQQRALRQRRATSWQQQLRQYIR